MRVAGVGFRGAATAESLADALQGLGHVTALATLDRKAAALEGLAAGLNLPVLGITPDMLAAQVVQTHSARVTALHCTGSVAEAAALAAAGSGARLVVARVTSADGMATAAIAEGSGT